MAATYEYKITGLKKLPSLNGFDDVITNVDLSITVNVGIEGRPDLSWSVTDIYLDPPTTESFKPFSELTESEVLDWIMTLHPVPAVITNLEREVDNMLNPKEHIQGPQLPWASGSINV
jgi:hypothetical protein